MLEYTRCWNIFEQIEVREIGLGYIPLSAKSLGPFLCSAKILAKRQACGTTPDDSDWLKIKVRIGAT